VRIQVKREEEEEGEEEEEEEEEEGEWECRRNEEWDGVLRMALLLYLSYLT
jgi:hypothetical protein